MPALCKHHKPAERSPGAHPLLLPPLLRPIIATFLSPSLEHHEPCLCRCNCVLSRFLLLTCSPHVSEEWQQKAPEPPGKTTQGGGSDSELERRHFPQTHLRLHAIRQNPRSCPANSNFPTQFSVQTKSPLYMTCKRTRIVGTILKGTSFKCLYVWISRFLVKISTGWGAVDSGKRSVCGQRLRPGAAGRQSFR